MRPHVRHALIAAIACSGGCAPSEPTTLQENNPPTATLDLFPGAGIPQLGLGDSVKATAQIISPDSAFPVPAGLVITSRSPDVISVDSNHWLHALAAGRSQIVATLPWHSSTLSDSVNVGVACFDLNAVVTFTPADTSIAVSETFTAHIMLTTCDGPVVNTEPWHWMSNNPAIASVDETSGLVTGVAAGSTTVTATNSRYGTLSGIAVTVH